MRVGASEAAAVGQPRPVLSNVIDLALDSLTLIWDFASIALCLRGAQGLAQMSSRE